MCAWLSRYGLHCLDVHQEYKQMWRKLADATGLPVSRVLDIRGNHDVFDTMRCGFAQVQG